VATTPRTPRRIALALTSLAVVTLLPAVGHADPRPSLSDVQRRVDALNAKADLIIEDYAQAKIALAAASQKAAVARGRVRAAQAQLAGIRKSMSAVAAAAYRSGGADQFVQLVSTSTPQTFLDRASSLDRIAAGQSAELAAAATARHRFAAASQDAATQQAAEQAVAAKLSADKQQIQDLLDQQQRILGSLKADQRRAFEAARQAASRSRVLDAPTYNGPASGRAAEAVRAAYAEIGKPYSWGASGPGSFDCSGLTMWSWGKAGVSLPHSAAAQYDSARHVSQGDLQPGDLVFFGSPIHHVGIYIGGGRMIDAPHSGDYVGIHSLYMNEYVGAARP
jgi:cell wall-associated NlpC family hydrolase